MDRSFGAKSPPLRTVRARRSKDLLLRQPEVGLALCFLTILSGCVDNNVAQAPDPSAPQPSNMARRQGVSPSGATVSVASFSGGPQDITDRFTPMFADAAKRGEINMADSDEANYLVRGYLAAHPEGNATAVAFVLDVFDAKKRRTQRVEDEVLINGQAADSWSLVDDAALAAVAAKSADDLAAVMTNTPEAIAASGVPPEGQNVAAEDGQTVVAASPPASEPPPAQAPTGALGLAALH
jgi:hypothetical protein